SLLYSVYYLSFLYLITVLVLPSVICYIYIFCYCPRHCPRSTLFSYTTLFRSNLYKRVVRNCQRGFPMIDGQQFSTQNIGGTVIIQRMKDFLSIVQILFPNV